MTTLFPIWCQNCHEQKEAVRNEENSVVSWRCGCQGREVLDEIFGLAYPNKDKPLPFHEDCNVRMSVTTPGVLADMLVASLHHTVRYTIERLKTEGVGYKVKIGRATFLESHTDTIFGAINESNEKAHQHHLAKTSNENLLIPTTSSQPPKDAQPDSNSRQDPPAEDRQEGDRQPGWSFYAVNTNPKSRK